MVFVYTLIDNHYTPVALVNFTFFHQKSKTGKERNVIAKETLVKYRTHEGKKGNYKIERKHPSLQSNKKDKRKELNSSGHL